MYPHTIRSKERTDIPSEIVDVLVQDVFAIPPNRTYISKDTPTIDIKSTDGELTVTTQASAVDILKPILIDNGFHAMSYDMSDDDKITLVQYTESGMFNAHLYNVSGTFTLDDALKINRLPTYHQSYA